MRIRSEKMDRDIKLKGDEVYINLNALDVMSKEDYMGIYDARVQEKAQLEQQIESYQEQIKKISEYEEDDKIKEIAKAIEGDKEVAQKVFALMQKKVISEQLQVWEKALESMKKELEDLSPMYKKFKAEIPKEENEESE